MPTTTRALERERIFAAAARMGLSSPFFMRMGSSVQPVNSAPGPLFSSSRRWAAAAAA